MIILYNLLQFVLLLLLWPFALALVVFTPRYRGRIWRRLGPGGLAGLAGLGEGPRIWVHALSVGEVRSAAALVRELRRRFPEHKLILSVATASGEALAQRELSSLVDAVIPFPLDFLPSASLWLKRIRPDLFIQIETDSWPDFLFLLKKKKVPAVLVNGRISGESLRFYRWFRAQVSSLFSAWRAVTVASPVDAEAFLSLGISGERIEVTGNLKYESAGSVPERSGDKDIVGEIIAGHGAGKVFIAASTHPGEEEVVLEAFCRIRAGGVPLFLILAPRNPARGGEIVTLAKKHGLTAARRSLGESGDCDLLVLDTIGELAALFPCAAAAFIGGSLVPERGHNPLEAAAHGVPVLFGPSMEDFADMARDLCACGGGRQIKDGNGLYSVLIAWLEDEDARRKAGAAALDLVRQGRGVTARVMAVVERVMSDSGSAGEGR